MYIVCSRVQSSQAPRITLVTDNKGSSFRVTSGGGRASRPTHQLWLHACLRFWAYRRRGCRPPGRSGLPAAVVPSRGDGQTRKIGTPPHSSLPPHLHAADCMCSCAAVAQLLDERPASGRQQLRLLCGVRWPWRPCMRRTSHAAPPILWRAASLVAAGCLTLSRSLSGCWIACACALCACPVALKNTCSAPRPSPPRRCRTSSRALPPSRARIWSRR